MPHGVGDVCIVSVIITVVSPSEVTKPSVIDQPGLFLVKFLKFCHCYFVVK